MANTKKLLVILVVIVAAAAAISSWRARKPASGDATPSGASTRTPRGGELVATLRSEPRTYNRYIDREAAGEVLSLLTHAPLVRVNRRTDTLEPWLAESWTQSDDRLTYTIKLRRGVAFSDGTPFTSADVVFSFRAVYDPRANTVLAGDVYVAGKPLHVEAPDPATVVLQFPTPFAPGLRMIEGIPILPRAKLGAALEDGTFRTAWSATTAVRELTGLGPFVLSQHVSGQRLVFVRNPHYWRRDAAGTQLPYLDRLTMLVVPDQNTESLRMQAGETDLMANADIRPEDYSGFKRIADQGRLRLIDGGVGLDPNMLWFNLSPARASDPRNAWLGQTAFRQAVSCAVDRQKIVNTVYLGTAVPVYGPVTPGNRLWYEDVRPACEHDTARARQLFASVGLTDRDGDGMLEDAAGAPARFSILTQRGHTIRERTATVLQEELRQAGVAVDVVALDPNALGQRWLKGDYDSIYRAFQASATDPALNMQFWLSSGDFHFWNARQPSPMTDWERRIDELMRRQAEAADIAERQRLFADVQRIFVQELPAIYFVAPKVMLAVSSRVVNPQPAPQIPQLLWTAETLGAAEPPP